MQSTPRPRRAFAAGETTESISLPAQQSAYPATNSLRPLKSKPSLDSLFSLQSWIVPAPLLAKEKLDIADKAKSGPLARLGGGLEKLPYSECITLAMLSLVACFVRLYRLDQPSSVVFDEVHFGGFATKYIKARFFMDVHPPLAKLLITLSAWIFRFSGNFDFKDIGKEYGPDKVPYIPMRLVPASFGIAVVPTAYCTMRMLGCGPTTALLAGTLVCFENSLITQSRLILLDSPLVFFTAFTVFLWSGFCNENISRSFTKRWWVWLSLTGLSLGAVLSVKWVGLFTIATIGIATIVQLWELLGDLNISVKTLFRHFVARAICLIGITLIVYMAMFEVHFLILRNSGDGDGFMSSEFQHSLNGHGMDDTYADVVLGSKISIKHLNTQGGYLHSHSHNYPTGSKQQQITLYPHRDDNNLWSILNSTVDPLFNETTDTPTRYVTDGMSVRLDHVSTSKKLHSHDHRPPVSEVDWQNEASAYGFANFDGDANDYWVIEIQKDLTDKGDRKAKQRLKAVRTKFRLRHLLQGCYLFSHKVKLPDWGFEQQEVTCNKNPTRANSIWYIETNTHPLLPTNAEKVNYRRPGFLAKFKELNAVMWRTNQGLTDRHSYDSRPEAWPYLRRGINFWVKNNRQIYLMGNPFTWWFSSLSVLLYIIVRTAIILRQKRGCQDLNNTTVSFYDRLCMFLALGWFMHYFPFFIMGRQLFLHHYLPALYFSILLFAAVFDLATHRMHSKVRLQVAGVVMLLSLWAFYHWSPLVYGNKWTKKECERAKWLSNWDFSCNDFKDKYSDYLPIVVADKQLNNSSIDTTNVGAAIEPGRNMFHEKMVDRKIDPSTAVKEAPPAEPKAVEAEDAPEPEPEKPAHPKEPAAPLRIIEEDEEVKPVQKKAEPPAQQTTSALTQEQARREEQAPIPKADVGNTQDVKGADQDLAVKEALEAAKRAVDQVVDQAIN